MITLTKKGFRKCIYIKESGIILSCHTGIIYILSSLTIEPQKSLAGDALLYLKCVGHGYLLLHFTYDLYMDNKCLLSVYFHKLIINSFVF